MLIDGGECKVVKKIRTNIQETKAWAHADKR